LTCKLLLTLQSFFNELSIFEFTHSEFAIQSNNKSLTILFSIFYLTFIYSTILISKTDFEGFVNFSLMINSYDFCILWIFHNTISLRFIIEPLTIIIESILIGLIFSTTISKSLLKLTDINLFLCYKLPLTRI